MSTAEGLRRETAMTFREARKEEARKEVRGWLQVLGV